MATNDSAILAPVVERLAHERAVAGVVLVGSRASGFASQESDYDVFVYTDGPLDDARAALAAELADANHPVVAHDPAFGDTDVWMLGSAGAWLDLMFWPTGWAEDELDRVLVRHQPKVGCSTAFWRSIRTGVALYERDAWHPQLQRRAAAPYPCPLREAILALNLPLVAGHRFSFRNQVAEAVARGDGVNVIGRTARWLESYFDVVLALNRVLHPGEKRLRDHVAAECEIVPDGFERDLRDVVASASGGDGSVVGVLDRMAGALHAAVASVAG